jgi:hypothetical protein
MSVVFLSTRFYTQNLISHIQDSKREGRQIVRANPEIGESVISAVCITLIIFLVYEIVRWLLKGKKILMQSLLTGLIPSGVLFLGLTLYSHNRTPLMLFLGVVPFLITGLLFPITEKLAFMLFYRKLKEL